jgi:hypothetical protein
MKTRSFLVFLTLIVTALVGFALPFLSSGKDWDPVFVVGLKTVALKILPTSQHHLIAEPVATEAPIFASELPATETTDPAVTATPTPIPTAQLSIQATHERRDRQEENYGFIPVIGLSAQPTNTFVPQPTYTQTLQPTPTDTPRPPTSTPTLQPTPTDTSAPQPTPTDLPTQEPTPADPPTQEPTPSNPPTQESLPTAESPSAEPPVTL